MEALAFGLPLVVSRRAGVSELVEDDKHALVVDVPEDVGELAPAIGRALDAGLASWLTQNGRELTER
jgi:glycosyltransferase involved in cell wall biosynthesis